MSLPSGSSADAIHGGSSIQCNVTLLETAPPTTSPSPTMIESSAHPTTPSPSMTPFRNLSDTPTTYGPSLVREPSADPTTTPSPTRQTTTLSQCPLLRSMGPSIPPIIDDAFPREPQSASKSEPMMHPLRDTVITTAVVAMNLLLLGQN